jgi:hypothetical protein
MSQTGPTIEHHLDLNTNEHWKISRRLTDNSNKPLIIKFIDFKMVLIDDLHMLLRISDKLFKLLLLKFIRLDQNEGKDLSLRKNLEVFIRFLEDNCKIKNPFYITDKPGYGNIQFRSFNGNERMRIFSELYEPKINIKTKKETTAPHLNGLYNQGVDPPYDFKKEDSVWFGFYSLYLSLKNYNNDSSILSIKEAIREWTEDYLYISKKENNSEKIFPYMHCLIFHYCEFLELHGNIHSFSTQPNEKLNDFFTQYFHKSTNKHNLDKSYLKQLLKKRNRIEFYNVKGDVAEFHEEDLSDIEDEFDEQDFNENDDVMDGLL